MAVPGGSRFRSVPMRRWATKELPKDREDEHRGPPTRAQGFQAQGDQEGSDQDASEGAKYDDDLWVHGAQVPFVESNASGKARDVNTAGICRAQKTFPQCAQEISTRRP